MQCPNCGAQLHGEANCPSCGAPITYIANNPLNPLTKPDKTTTFLGRFSQASIGTGCVGCLLVVLFFIGLIIYLSIK